MRWIRRGLCVLFLVTWVALIVLWSRSYWWWDNITVDHNKAFISGNGIIMYFQPPSRLSDSRLEVTCAAWSHLAQGWTLWGGVNGQRVIFPWDFSWRDPGRAFGRPPGLLVSAPHWAPLLAVSAVFVGYILRMRRRARPGACAACGYDLTGNVSGRCPECGSKVDG